MGKIVRPEDFKNQPGKFKLNFDQGVEQELQFYIDRYEKSYLRELLGVGLFDLFYADITTPFTGPNTPIYQNIYNEITQDDGNCIRVSRGIKDMIMGFIWFEFVRDAKYKPTTVGHVANIAENSREASFNELNIYGRYNESILSYDTIQWYIVKNKTATVYEKYNGQCKGISHWT